MTDAFAPGVSPTDAPPAPTLPTEPNATMLEEDDADITALPPRRRVPTLTKLLFVAIVGALAFGGGVLVQKQHDAALTSAARVPNFASLFGAGGPPGGVGAGGPSASTATGAGSGAGGSTSAVPVLVGTVESVSGSDLTVKDLGGKSHVVHATASTTLSVVGPDWSGSLKTGATVSVQGTKAADGSVTATMVTQR